MIFTTIPTLDGKIEFCLDKSLIQVLSLFPIEIEHNLDLSSPDAKIFIVCSWHDIQIKELFSRLIKFAYSQSENNKKITCRFLFISANDYSIDSEEHHLFWTMARLFESKDFATVKKPEHFLPELLDIITKANGEVQLTPTDVRNEIEIRCCPSGAGEMLEMLFRKKGVLHSNLLPDSDEDNDKRAAVRLLYGAYCAGDIDSESFKQALEKIGKQGSSERIAALTEEPLSEFLDPSITLGNMQESIDGNYRSQLREYLSGRKILLIEDRLINEGWNVALPILFGSVGEIEENAANTPFDINLSEAGANTHFNVTHCRSCLDALKLNEELISYDLIILDLYSSFRQNRISHPMGTHLANIPHPIWTLMKRINDSYENINDYTDTQKGSPKPAVIVFSVESNGATVLRALGDLGLSTYFFKKPRDIHHKAAYYSSFRNAIVDSLTSETCKALKIPVASRDNRLNQWIRNFKYKHRPTILNLMKYFRYFEARDVIGILDTYFKNEMSSLEGQKVIFSFLGRPNKSGPVTLSLFGKTDWVKNHSNGNMEFKTYEQTQNHINNLVKYPMTQIIKDIISQLVRYNNEHSTSSMNIVFLDDVSGTGGQGNEYSSKFFNKHLGWEYSSVKWKHFCNTVKHRKIKFYLIYALGVGRKYSSSLEGDIIIGNPKNHIKIKRLIALKTLALGDLFPEKLPDCVKDALSHYLYIVTPRKSEFPCQFEPYGWKGEDGNGGYKDGNGGLFATYFNTPGNTIPVIWGSRNDDNIQWYPLYDRIFNPLITSIQKETSESKRKCLGKSNCILDPTKPAKYCSIDSRLE